jgi:3-oxoadipate enol-lactonase
VARAVVYVPGWGTDADFYADVVTAVPSPDQRVVDLAGAASLEEMEGRVERALGPGDALVGVSMGGWVARAVAARRPELVGRLVLGSTWAEPPPRFITGLEASVRQLERGEWGDDARDLLALNFAPANRGPLVDRLVAQLERLGIPAVLAQARAMLAAPAAAPADAIAAPALVLAGAHDPAFTAAEQRADALGLLAAGRATVGFELVASSGHNLPLERPDRVAAAVTRWCLGERPEGFDALP